MRVQYLFLFGYPLFYLLVLIVFLSLTSQISTGAPCNVPWTGSSDPGVEDCGNQNGGFPLLATIATFAPNGGALTVVARGVRNSVGITYHPDTEEMWFTENGRDQCKCCTLLRRLLRNPGWLLANTHTHHLPSVSREYLTMF